MLPHLGQPRRDPDRRVKYFQVIRQVGKFASAERSLMENLLKRLHVALVS